MMTKIMMLLIPTVTIFSIAMTRKHLLLVLILLETMTLSLLPLISPLTSSQTMSSPMAIIILLSLSACEVSLGLSLFVIMLRSHGSDTMKLTSMTKM